MGTTAPRLVRDDDYPAPLSLDPAAERRRTLGRVKRLKRTLDEGESEWTWLIVLLSDYAIAIPLFLFMLAAAELAYHFG